MSEWCLFHCYHIVATWHTQHLWGWCDRGRHTRNPAPRTTNLIWNTMRDLRSSCCELLQARHLAILTLASWSVIEEAFCQSCCCWNLIQASCFNTCKPHICNRIMTYWKWKLHSIWKLSEGPVRRPFWTILNKNWYCSEAPLQNPILSIWGKKSFLSEMVQ